MILNLEIEIWGIFGNRWTISLISRCAEEFGSLFGSHNPGDIPSSIQFRLSAQGWCILLILGIFHLQYNSGYQLKVAGFIITVIISRNWNKPSYCNWLMKIFLKFYLKFLCKCFEIGTIVQILLILKHICAEFRWRHIFRVQQRF